MFPAASTLGYLTSGVPGNSVVTFPPALLTVAVSDGDVPQREFELLRGKAIRPSPVSGAATAWGIPTTGTTTSVANNANVSNQFDFCGRTDMFFTHSTRPRTAALSPLGMDCVP